MALGVGITTMFNSIDHEDLRDLRQAKEEEGAAATVSIADVKALLNLA